MEGATAFAKFYLHQLDKASRDGGPESLNGLALPTCSTCQAFIHSLEALQRTKRHHRGVTIEVTSTEVISFTSDERKVLLRVSLHAVPIVEASGSRVGYTEADTGAFIASLTYQGRWSVSRLQVAK